MAKYKKPLEWVYQSIHTTTAAVENARFELGLKDDEVAEIHKVMSGISPAPFAAGGADLAEMCNMALSMDPDVQADPSDEASQADLEWFYTHNYDQQIELTTSGAWAAKINDEKSEDFDPPILVGTDVGMVVKNDTKVCDSYARIYFTRRKANVMELNQVLLKRR